MQIISFLTTNQLLKSEYLSRLIVNLILVVMVDFKSRQKWHWGIRPIWWATHVGYMPRIRVVGECWWSAAPRKKCEGVGGQKSESPKQRFRNKNSNFFLNCYNSITEGGEVPVGLLPPGAYSAKTSLKHQSSNFQNIWIIKHVHYILENLYITQNQYKNNFGRFEQKIPTVQQKCENTVLKHLLTT